MDKSYDVIVIGGGPAGSTSSLYTSRANLSTLVIDKGIRLGALGSTPKISNFPGIPEIGGVELLENMQNQAKSFGAEYISTRVIGVDIKSDMKTIFTNDGAYKAKSIILATGAMGQKNSLKGEKEFLGRGVSYCATCDGAFYKNETVAVIGNNDEALEELLFLTKFAKKIYLIVKQKELKGQEELVEKVKNNPKVEILYQTNALEIGGKFGVENIKIATKGASQEELKISGAFIYLQGNKPITEYSSGQIELSEEGCVIVNSSMETSQKGVYAIGDLLCTHPKQVAIAAGDGVIAAMAIDKWINNKSKTTVDWKK